MKEDTVPYEMLSTPKPESVSSLPIGDLIPGDIAAEYCIEEKLGEGGFGTVYRAVHVVLGRQVAIKVLHHRHCHRAEVVARFVAEARAVNHIRHRGIIDIFAFGTLPDGRHFFVMELLNGEPLDKLLAQAGPLEPDVAIALLRDVARALDAAHAKGIAHRDLKPENVFLVTDERGLTYPKLLDFGIAKLCMAQDSAERTPTGEQLGTPQYMSPEQCTGLRIDRRTDIYSLGILSHQLLTGRLPFDQYPHLEVLVAHMKVQPPKLSDHHPALGTAFDAAVLHMLEKNAASRPRTAVGAIEALEKAALFSRRPSARYEVGPKQMERRLVVRPERQLSLPTKAKEDGAARRRRAKIARTLAAMIATLGVTLTLVFWHVRSSKGTRNDAATRTQVMPPSAVSPPVRISMLYSSEKREWIESASASFAKDHPEIELTLMPLGSLASARALMNAESRPTIWSPADWLELQIAADEWTSKTGGHLVAREGADAPQSLALTPLVFVIWEDRADVLLAAWKGQITWWHIHDAITNKRGWRSLGGKASWGDVKLGHTDPSQSNSGLQALSLMALEYSGKSEIDSEDASNPGFLKFLTETEARCKSKPTSDTFMVDMVRFGPSKYDLGVVYENLAISQFENARGRWGNLRVYYPTPTLWSDHPAAILQTDWVTEQQREAARTWLAYLRSHGVQERALALGLRPIDLSVSVLSSESNNPWRRLAAAGVQVAIPPAATPPDGATARELISRWSRVVGGK